MRLVFAGMAALLLSCHRYPAIQENFRISYTPSIGAKVQKNAPIIVKGVVTAVSIIGNPVRARYEPRVLLDLTRVTFRPEVFLRGTVQGESFIFYYYSYSSRNTGTLGQPTCEFRVNERRLVFLLHEFENLRTVFDVTDCGLRVYSGMHKKRQLPERLDDALAAVLLVPGAGIDAEKFVFHLEESAEDMQRLTSRALTAKFLRDLTHSNSSSIATAACLHLAEKFHVTTGCLNEIESSASASTETRVSARELSRRTKEFWTPAGKPLQLASLEDALQRMPPDAQHTLLDEIKVYTLHGDPAVHAAACALIKPGLFYQSDWDPCRH